MSKDDLSWHSKNDDVIRSDKNPSGWDQKWSRKNFGPQVFPSITLTTFCKSLFKI